MTHLVTVINPVLTGLNSPLWLLLIKDHKSFEIILSTLGWSGNGSLLIRLGPPSHGIIINIVDITGNAFQLPLATGIAILEFQNILSFSCVGRFRGTYS